MFSIINFKTCSEMASVCGLCVRGESLGESHALAMRNQAANPAQHAGTRREPHPLLMAGSSREVPDGTGKKSLFSPI